MNIASTSADCRLGISFESETSVRQLLRHVDPVPSDENCMKVLDRFIADDELQALAVVDGAQKPVGLVDRGRLIEIFIRPFAKDLHHKKPIAHLMDREPVIVDADSSIDDLAQIIIDSGMRHMVNGFIISQNGTYAGMGTGQDLMREITGRRQRHLYLLAHFDPLTGLPNRLLFQDRLRQAVQLAQRHGTGIALIFVDLDRFKAINDAMGHAFGDSLLKCVAERMSGSVRESDTVARIGGDEFVIVLQHIVTADDAQMIAHAVLNQLSQPLTVLDQPVHLTASLGLALFPQHDESVDGLIRKADAAMYEAKQRGRNGVVFYENRFSEAAEERLSLQAQLAAALEMGQFFLAYQPQVDLQSGRMVGVEALLRWRHPDLGIVPPDRFIPIAEEIGLLVPIGEWVLRAACACHCRLHAAGLAPVRIAVNLSATQFRHHDFEATIRRIISETGMNPHHLELELTEGMVMTDTRQTLEMLDQLRALGVQLAIDDFGTGYSSLSYLRRFPLDRIKIDRSFTHNIDTVQANQAIVKAIIALGDHLGLQVIAEGIETYEESAFMRRHGCREGQGYYFSRPLPEEQLQRWLTHYRHDCPDDWDDPVPLMAADG